MMIKLLASQIRSLIDQPESGMGYQTVEVEYQTTKKKATVYNAELLMLEHEPRTMLVEAFETLINKASVSEAQFIKSIRVVSPPKVAVESITAKYLKELQGAPATEGDSRKTKEGEVFARFTAYKNDRRITPNKGLMPGTYATTEADAKNVKTGSDAVERYALPDPMPAIYRYKIEPRKDTTYRQGVVQPAYKHKGGGVEVIFYNGTDDKTVTVLAVLSS
jgi:hypothetical protein